MCDNDEAIPAAAQEAMVARARDMGASVEVAHVRAGHSPFLSCVEETAAWIEGVAAGGEGRV